MMINSKDLLSRYFELKSLSKVEQWSEESFKNNKPRLYRYQQLKAIFLAFEIPFDIELFSVGAFIQYNDKKYLKVIDKISTDIEYKINQKELKTIFKRLLKYCESLQGSLNFNNGVLICNNEFLYTIKQTNIVNQDIKNSLEDIVDILSTIIDPDCKSFTIEDLNTKYNYPIIDLLSIDIENL